MALVEVEVVAARMVAVGVESKLAVEAVAVAALVALVALKGVAVAGIYGARPSQAVQMVERALLRVWMTEEDYPTRQRCPPRHPPHPSTLRRHRNRDRRHLDRRAAEGGRRVRCERATTLETGTAPPMREGWAWARCLMCRRNDSGCTRRVCKNIASLKIGVFEKVI